MKNHHRITGMEEIMEDTKNLAIASVGYQSYKETYEFSEALQIGTVFPELNKPFFAADKGEKTVSALNNSSAEKTECEKLLQKINEISFAVNDLSLYLDTHCEETEPRYLYHKCIKERKILLEEFAQKFYPLTQDCLAKASCEKPNAQGETVFSWSVGPLPWEGVCV